jgi:hypothetical protein
MTDPAKFDDDWAELARELERDNPSSPPPPQSTPPEVVADLGSGSIPEPPPVEGEESGPDEFDDAGTIGSESDVEAESILDSVPGDDQQGAGRKRRRRRRRRRKGGTQPAEVEGVEDTESEKSLAQDAELEEVGFETETAASDVEYGDEPPDEFLDDVPEASAEESEEDAGGELLRELIANWNVPSWDDVVSGLYRPER